MLDEATLLEARGGSVIAPAGCGKTELIARAVRAMPCGRALVLTHTHAGVRALRDRLKRFEITRERAHVETLAGWCLRYSSAYPGRSQVAGEFADNWNAVYAGAQLLLDIPALRTVVQASYTAVFVDEYQDCTRTQHAVILALSRIVPTWVLGDPLQGIFGFAGGNLSWSREVEASFPPLGELSTPWRWKKHHALGQWVSSIRPRLLAGDSIDLRRGPLRASDATPENQRREAFRLLKASGRVVIIRKWAGGAHDFARSMGGAYRSMEDVECNDLLTFAAEMDVLKGASRAERLLLFAGDCLTGISTKLSAARRALSAGRLPDPKRFKEAAVVGALVAVATSNDVLDVIAAMDQMAAIPDVKAFRQEIWQDARRACEEFGRGEHGSLGSSASSIRNRRRFAGRALDERCVSRTLLIKGLEFEHALVLNAMEYEDPSAPGDGARHFYVAATRGSSSLSVLSPTPIVRFTPPTL